MQIEWWTLGFQTVNVLVLVWLLGRFLFRPVADMVARRQAEASRMIDEAEAAGREAQEARAAAADEARQAASRRSELLQAEETEAEARKAALLNEAREEALKLRAAAEEQLRRGQEEAEREAENRARMLAVDIAAKLMGRLPDEMRILPFLPGLAGAVESLLEADRSALKAQAARGALPVTVPREPTEEERRACETALATVLGAEVSAEVTVEPAVIAGLEIRGDEAVLRNSLRADLEVIAAELTRND